MGQGLQFQQYMFIDSPNFVRRRVINSDRHSQAQNKSEFYDFGKEREQLLSHVTSALMNHARDEEILQKFRKEAEMMKKKKYESKRHPKNESYLSYVSEEIAKEPDQIIYQEQSEDIRTPRIDKERQRSPELEVVLRHSNDLVEKYRKILSIKEKELRRKDRKLQSRKLTLQKMSLRVKEFQRERQLINREEEVEMSKIQLTLRQMGTQISQNKTTVAKQISALKEELKSHDYQEVPKLSQFSISQSRPKENNPLQVKPRREQQLEGIKRKAKSMKFNNQFDKLKNPSVIYTKIQTQQSQEMASPKKRDYLDSLDSSIVNQSRFRALSGVVPERAEF